MTSETSVGAVMYLSFGIESIAFGLSVFLHLHLGGKRMTELPREREWGEEAMEGPDVAIKKTGL